MVITITVIVTTIIVVVITIIINYHPVLLLNPLPPLLISSHLSCTPIAFAVSLYAFIFFPFSHSFPLFSLRVVFPNLLQGGSLPNSMKTGWFSCFICQSFNFFVFLSFLRRASPAIFYFYLQTP